MEVALESVRKNKDIYNDNVNKILKQRADLMQKVTELRKQKETLTDEISVAQNDFEESKLVQQINDLTSVFKGNKLTLEQLGLQEDILQSKIDRETYSKGMVANRKEKAHLYKEQELTYCENEVIKCQKGLKLYTMIGDNEGISKWQKALEQAQKDLEFARTELEKEKTISEKDSNNSQMKTVQRDRQSTRQSQQEEYKENPETKTRSNDNPESFRDTFKFNLSYEMQQEILNKHQEIERDFKEGRMNDVENGKIEDTEYGVR